MYVNDMSIRRYPHSARNTPEHEFPGEVISLFVCAREDEDCVRPGVFHKHIKHAGEVYVAYDSWCQDCGRGDGATFMVHEALWREHYPLGGDVCPACFERTLGRLLTRDDLTDCLANKMFLGKRAGETGPWTWRQGDYTLVIGEGPATVRKAPT